MNSTSMNSTSFLVGTNYTGDIDDFETSGFYPAWVSLALVVMASFCACFFLWLIFKIMESFNSTIEETLEASKDEKHIDFVGDAFYREHGYNYDVVIAVDNRLKDLDKELSEYQKDMSLERITQNLRKALLQCHLMKSMDGEQTLILIRALPNRLQREATRQNLPMVLDPELLKEVCAAGSNDEDHEWKPVRYSKKLFPDDLKPFQNIYAPYDKERADSNEIPYKTYDVGPFRNCDRIDLIHNIIENAYEMNGAGMNLATLIREKAVITVFPLHDYSKLLTLQKDWIKLRMFPGDQPNNKIRDYFGAKIALYFCFLNHYTLWLIPAAVAGMISWIVTAYASSNPDNISVPYFTIFMCIWATLFIETWKRKRFRQTSKWGMVGYRSKEQPRPEFKLVASHRESAVTGRQEEYYPKRKLFMAMCLSVSVVTTFISIVVIAVVACYLFRANISFPYPEGKYYIRYGDGVDDFVALGMVIASFLNAIQIMILDIVYGKVAVWLTNRENHATESKFEDSLIGKTFCFRFVNSYMSLFYIAFMKEYLSIVWKEKMCEPNCISELNLSLGIIFFTNISVGNITEIFIPFLLAKYKEKQLLGKVKKQQQEGTPLTPPPAMETTQPIAAMQTTTPPPTSVSDGIGQSTGGSSGDVEEDAAAAPNDAPTRLSLVEAQYLQIEYDPTMGSFNDYNEMVLQFGYCTLFVAAFPLATVLALANNFVESRVDAWKLCQTHRRPWPVGAEDIGTWLVFLKIMSILAIVTNMAIFCFTGSLLDGWTWKERIVIFVCMEHILVGGHFMIAMLAPDVPLEVSNHLKRQEFIISKVVLQVADEHALGKNDENEIEDKREWHHSPLFVAQSLQDKDLASSIESQEEDSVVVNVVTGCC